MISPGFSSSMLIYSRVFRCEGLAGPAQHRSASGLARLTRSEGRGRKLGSDPKVMAIMMTHSIFEEVNIGKT
jgi:hypothetical protein